MVAMVTMNLFKFHSFLALLPHFLLAEPKFLWNEYENYVKLQEEENTKNFKSFQGVILMYSNNLQRLFVITLLLFIWYL